MFVSGRMQCAPGYATKPLYVTIIPDEDQPRAKTAQSVNQSFCMVQTPSMGKSFMLVEYPYLTKVLKATTDLIDITGGTKLVVEQLDENQPIVKNGKMPRDFGKEYQFSLVQAGALVGSKTLLYFIFSEYSMLGLRRIIQTGKCSSVGQEDERIIVDLFQNNEWERFSFENPPAAELTDGK